MPRQTHRRDFLKTAAVASAGFFVSGTPAADEKQKLKFAVIGVGGRGSAGVGPGLGENLVAVAEVDPGKHARNSIERIQKDSPGTKIYTDFRKLFDAHKDLDAVWVGTPDHTHFPASIRALEQGAGVYCEKPLTHNIYEARKLREVAAKKKAPTQMGNQGHSSDSIRLICEYIWSGTLGDVKEVQCVSNRGFGAKSRPKSVPVPQGLDWESWLGPAPFRDYHPGLHAFSWRGWLDFGTGSLGDMGCHTIDGAVWALKLYEADQFEVELVSGGVSEEGFDSKAELVYKFPARGKLPPVNMRWYNGGILPPRPKDLEADKKQLTEGTYYLGTKATMQSGSHCQGTALLPDSKNKETPKPKEMIPRVQGGHTGDFLRACRDRSGPAPSSNFDYSARLTEIVIAGTLALRAGESIVYDMKNGRVTNSKKADALVKRAPRKGWEFGYES
ncbi:MAG: Gfo/Idh/MocA family protein [Gemmataceae bacterium]